jgi:hypothetical protein
MVASGDDEDADVDVLEVGRDRPSWQRNAAPYRIICLLVLAVAIGGLIGYAAGGRHTSARTTTPASLPTRTPSHDLIPSPVVSPGVTETGQRCSEQLGRKLELGVEVVNESTSPVTLGKLIAQLPLKGLRAISAAKQTCGQLAPVPGALPSTTLAAGGTAWLRMTFDVLEKCPRGFPVEFTISFRQAGQSGSTELFAFPDLGSVPYTGCAKRATPSTSG